MNEKQKQMIGLGDAMHGFAGVFARYVLDIENPTEKDRVFMRFLLEKVKTAAALLEKELEK